VGCLDVVKEWPVDHAAVAVVDADGVLATTGPDDLVLPWASVTKPVTALTVLTAVDRGEVSLDEPAGPPGATVRHLIAHTAGVAFDSEQVVGAVGRRRIYSNAGFELLAGHVSARTGRTFADLARERVLDPLGMDATTLAGSPAADGRGPLRDLARFGRELLAPTLVSGPLMAEATAVAFPGLAGVLPGFGRQDPNDWGLGFEIRDGKRPHWTGTGNSPATFGHFGASGTFLWVDPGAGLACACLTDRAFGEWAAQAWPVVSDRVLEEFAR
jgi:CubicO group peptidase (beta-lactamase class C family)